MKSNTKSFEKAILEIREMKKKGRITEKEAYELEQELLQQIEAENKKYDENKKAEAQRLGFQY